MQQINIPYQTDFKVFIRTEAGFALPFKFEFFTNMPSRPFVAKYDGKNYHNCQLLDDGRLCIAFDHYRSNFGMGKLMVKQTYYLTDRDYADESCDRVIAPQPVVNIDDHENRAEIILALSGDDTVEFTTQLPPYYQAGLTPEEHQALLDATEDANEAAALANEKAGVAEEAARKADEAREQITTTFSEKVAALENDYTQKKAALDADYAQAKSALAADYAEVKGGLQSDYEAKKQALDADYAAKKSALEADYTSVKSALAASYAEAINGINQRMTAIEQLYTADKAEWQRQVDAMLAKCVSDFEAAEAQRETRVNTAVQSANTATTNANQKATEAGKVNAVLNGDNLTVTDRNGQSVTRNVRGPKGDSVTMFPAVTIFGQPRIQETQMSEFSAQNYAQFPFLVDFAGRHWQLDCAITTGADVSQQHNVFDSAFGLAFAFSGGKFVLAMSSNGIKWNLGATSGTHSILANTTYYIRITWDGTAYVLAYSTDKVSWTNDITVTSSESLASKQIIIGKSLDNAHIFNGSINFAEARLTIAGVIVWEGMEEVGTATRMAIDMSNIDEAGKQKVNDIIGMGAIGKAISPYSKSITLPLTHNLATGSILAMEGDMVVLKAQQGWGITRIDREEFGALGLASGDTLLLPMAHFDAEGKPTDNLMMVGAVLFAAEEAVKSQSGEVLYTRRTSLFRATDNAIATWGGVKKWLAIADNESLLICHPLDITSATITRNGNDAASAAADLNQRGRIDEKLTRGARDSRAWVGMCDMFAPSEKTEQAAYRDEVLPAGRILGFAPELGPSGAGTRDGQIADSVSPVMREVSGVSGGGNQIFSASKVQAQNMTIAPISDNGFQMTPKSGMITSNNFTFYFDSKKKYLVILQRITDVQTDIWIQGDTNPLSFKGISTGNQEIADSTQLHTIGFTMSANGSGSQQTLWIYPSRTKESTATSNTQKIWMNYVCLDSLFPTDTNFVNSFPTASQVAHKLGFLALQRD